MPRDAAVIVPVLVVGQVNSESESESEQEFVELHNVQITGGPQLEALPLLQSTRGAFNASPWKMLQMLQAAMFLYLPRTDVGKTHRHECYGTWPTGSAR